LVGHCRLVVVDCDDDAALAAAEERFGHTPVLVRTPSGRGGHLYYRAPPDQEVLQANLRRSEGLAIDIKAGRGAYVICPPSVRPSNGIAYAFERGGWDDLPDLPEFKATAAGSNVSSRQVAEGSRNNHLFRRALDLAPDCETGDELAVKLHVVNEAECAPPVRQEEVEKTAASAWRCQVERRNWVGQGRYAQVPAERFERLADAPDAFTLDTRMRFAHEGRRDRFAASPKAMAAAAKGVMPGWTAARYRKAIRVLVERGVWTLLKRGGRGAGDPHEYGFADRSRPAREGAFTGGRVQGFGNRTQYQQNTPPLAACRGRRGSVSEEVGGMNGGTADGGFGAGERFPVDGASISVRAPARRGCLERRRAGAAETGGGHGPAAGRLPQQRPEHRRSGSGPEAPRKQEAVL
ncbi:MAG: bifunctional DNA primase/polymerase, partial [Acetobacteraceae bacterium]|nr:bifunctional DNA primase/polymerase [Acetobacteraceae bacterium]